MSICARDSIKLLNAGFTLLRLDLNNRRITQLTNNGGWKVIANYKTKTAAQIAWRLFMNNKKVVEG